ncbi:hypothetical protein BB561_003454 [Smittium simulii]|uniref:coproporphyrinogen oxidase n=1 Tax=Smittium simulii TaxID=133385 RepID=A0A2T9YLA8_9FUNG|nr:hypothetical protein BB561_003454 [Smittium simulii]
MIRFILPKKHFAHTLPKLRAATLRSSRYSQSSKPNRGFLEIQGINPGVVMSFSFAAATIIASASYYFFMDKPDPALIEYNKKLVQIDMGERRLTELDMNFPSFDEESTEPIKGRMEKFVLALQKSLVKNLEILDNTKPFFWDRWEREDSKGYGISCILQDSKIFEKAGVNVSIMQGPLSKQQLESMKSRKQSNTIKDNVDYDFWVAGISTVIHPVNPMAPTVHFNYRYFELTERDDPEQKVVTSWFGGGADLTPSYLFEEDCAHFHQTLKDSCDKHDQSFYPKFKKNCDEYFFIPHRNETRGIGGIFFDDLNDRPKKDLFHFIFDMGFSFHTAYLPLIAKRMNMSYTKENKEWQQIRRGRYVEFNLVNDRGTKFGLHTKGGRTESILMSLPLTARWEYKHSIPLNSSEQKLLDVLKTSREWA